MTSVLDNSTTVDFIVIFVFVLFFILYSYLEHFQRGDLFLDSHHHGGCNTVLDAIITQTPMVTLHKYNINQKIDLKVKQHKTLICFT